MIFFSFPSSFALVRQGGAFPAGTHPSPSPEETGVTGAGSRVSLWAEDVPHPEGLGTSGSRRQHHLGCAKEQKQLWSGSGLADDLPKVACRL